MLHHFILAEDVAGARTAMITWLGIIMAVIVVGFVGILILRRRLYGADTSTEAAPMGFSLADLRTLRDRGELTQQEFDQAKIKILAQAKKRLEENPPKMPKRKGPPPQGLQLPDDDNLR